MHGLQRGVSAAAVPPAAAQPDTARPTPALPSQAPLRLDLRPARALMALLAGLHVLVIAAAWVSLDGLPFVIVSIATVLSGWRTMAEALLAAPTAILWLELAADGRAAWGERGAAGHAAAQHAGRLGAQALVWPGLVVFTLQPDPPPPPGARARARRVVMDGWSAEPEALRALRVRLRWRATAAVSHKLTAE